MLLVPGRQPMFSPLFYDPDIRTKTNFLGRGHDKGAIVTASVRIVSILEIDSSHGYFGRIGCKYVAYALDCDNLVWYRIYTPDQAPIDSDWYLSGIVEDVVGGSATYATYTGINTEMVTAHVISYRDMQLVPCDG